MITTAVILEDGTTHPVTLTGDYIDRPLHDNNPLVEVVAHASIFWTPGSKVGGFWHKEKWLPLRDLKFSGVS